MALLRSVQCEEKHRCETHYWRECVSCGRFSCTKFTLGQCRRCTAKRRYHAKLKFDYRAKARQSASGKRWYEKNKEWVLARTKAYMKLRRTQYNDWCRDWRKKNLMKARAAGVRCEWKKRHPGEAVPMIVGCQDCFRVSVFKGIKLDAFCRFCEGVHVIVLSQHEREGTLGKMPQVGA